MEDDTSQVGGKADAYRDLIKPGDAVETPDKELWVVEEIGGGSARLTSALRDSAGQIYLDIYEPITTTVSTEYVRKVADARQVRRP